MKKIKILTLAIACLALCLASCKGKKSDKDFTISGTLPAGVDAEWVYLYSADSDNPTAIDSARVDKGSFRFKGIAPDTLTLAFIHPGKMDDFPALAWSLFLEPGDMLVDTTSEFVTGTPINDGIRDWMGQLSSIMMGGGTTDHVCAFFREHWNEHSTDFVGALVLAQMSPYMDFSLVDSLANDVPAEVREHKMLSGFFQQLDGLRSMQPGHAFTDINLVSLDGKPAAISDFVGQGKYVLVDFWASWCGPCRKAIPELQSIVKKYKDLVVFGIAVSDKIEDTQKAVADLKISWPVLSDPEATSAKSYGVSAIPAMILFAPDGTILARDFTLPVLDDLLTTHLK